MPVPTCPSSPDPLLQPTGLGQAAGGDTSSESNARTICVVAADVAVQQALTMLLRSAGFHTAGFNSCGTVLEALALQPGCSCLVIDHHLPGGIDALALLKQMAQMELSVPAVIANASATNERHLRALQSGAIAIIPKPLIDDTILHAVAELTAHVGFRSRAISA